MSELLPYEEQLQQEWTDIPLPEENSAWDDMRSRLDEEDKERVFFFWWRSGCTWWLLALLLTGIGWWILRKEDHSKNTINRSDKPISEKTIPIEAANKPADSNKKLQPGKPYSTDNIDPVIGDNHSTFHLKRKQGSSSEENLQLTRAVNDANLRVPVPSARKIGRKQAMVADSTNNLPQNITPGDEIFSLLQPSGKSVTRPDQDPLSEKDDQLKESDKNPSNSSFVQAGSTDRSDSTVADSTNNTSTLIQKDKTSPLFPAASSKDKSANKFFVSTGLALQQQIPVSGQKPNPYNSVGRKSSIADYVPSVYLRLHRKEKWFLQTEFRYGAPQYAKEFLYKQVSIIDTGRTPRFTTNTSAKLKKTFYHQLPVSFHYHITPEWTAGAGVIWNKFYAAISDRETIKHDLNTQADSVVFKGIESTKKDTTGTFARSYFQAVIETQYRWKRLSMGARYAFGLEPYIRFSLPGIGQRQEKNASIQLFLRLELWRSQKEKDKEKR